MSKSTHGEMGGGLKQNKPTRGSTTNYYVSYNKLYKVNYYRQLTVPQIIRCLTQLWTPFRGSKG